MALSGAWQPVGPGSGAQLPLISPFRALQLRAVHTLAGTLVDFPTPGGLRVRRGVLHIGPDGRIQAIETAQATPPRLLLPAFFDLHTHWPQWRVRGRAVVPLLRWLDTVIYPEERRFRRAAEARRVARAFLQEALRLGITTVVSYATVHARATEVAFEEAEKLGLRFVSGKMMMDAHAPPGLQESTETSLAESQDLARRWHGKHGRLFYAFSPRFALTVSRDLLMGVAEAARALGTYIQTHMAESPDEIQALRQITGAESYASYYHETGLLGPKTLLGHCIHLRQQDAELLRNTRSRVIHNPSANLFLHSGRFPVELLDRVGLDFALGSDVGAGPSLSPFEVMRDAFYLNPLSPARLFYHATLGAARALGWQNRLGTLDPGKDADLVVLKWPRNLRNEPVETVLSVLIFTGGHRLVQEVYRRGERLV